MPVETERKFLVKKDLWQKADKSIPDFYRQGYLYSDALKTIRIRVANKEAWITIKGKTTGASRPEYEYSIPVDQAQEMLSTMTENCIEKYRYKITVQGKLWEVDEFKGDNEGLLLAEIELENENENFILPEWIGAEVTEDPRYFNASLSKLPFTKWK